MNNTEQFTRYLKRIECDGSIITRKDVAMKMIERCERWIFQRRDKNFMTINSFTFDEWAAQDEVLDSLFELCKKYREQLK